MCRPTARSVTNGLDGPGMRRYLPRLQSYNFDVERFFTKWLHDLAADQMENGAVGHVVPDYLVGGNASAAWADAATICPWQILSDNMAIHRS